MNEAYGIFIQIAIVSTLPTMFVKGLQSIMYSITGTPKNQTKRLSDFRNLYTLLILIYIVSMFAYTDISRRDHYKTLQCQPNVDIKDLRLKHRKLSLQYHPDKSSGIKEDYEANYLEIRDAYEVLKDPVKRIAYDTFGQFSTECAKCRIFSDYFAHSIPHMMMFYFPTIAFIAVQDFANTMRFSSWARFCLFIMLVVFESHLTTDLDSFVKNFFPWRTPAHLITLARQLFVSFSIALNHISSIYFPVDQRTTIELIDTLQSAFLGTFTQAKVAFWNSTAPFRNDSKLAGYVKGLMEQELLEKTIIENDKLLKEKNSNFMPSA